MAEPVNQEDGNISKADQDQKWKHDKYDQICQETQNTPMNQSYTREQYDNENSFSSGGHEYKQRYPKQYDKNNKQY